MAEAFICRDISAVALGDQVGGPPDTVFGVGDLPDRIDVRRRLLTVGRNGQRRPGRRNLHPSRSPLIAGSDEAAVPPSADAAAGAGEYAWHALAERSEVANTRRVAREACRVRYTRPSCPESNTSQQQHDHDRAGVRIARRLVYPRSKEAIVRIFQAPLGLSLIAVTTMSALMVTPHSAAKPRLIEVCVATAEKKSCAYRSTAGERTAPPVVTLANSA